MTSEFVQGANVAIPLADAEEVSQRFENTLYGYFIGKRLAFTLVETYVKNAWAKFGLEQTMLTNGFFFFQFATREGLERVLENGPWLIRLVVDSNPVEDEDGVTQVKRKNGKGKQDVKAKQVAGIHLTKPKPKMVNREVQEPPTNNNDKATTSNYDSSLRKDNQPTMQPEDGINIFSLRNSFESDSLEAVLDDDDEQVEEVYIEDNVRHAKTRKSKKAKTRKSKKVCMYFKADKKELFCSFVYAHNRYIQRRDMWNNLGNHKNYIRNRPWCIVGDFNVSLSADEKSTGPSNIDTGMRDFQDCVEAIEEICEAVFVMGDIKAPGMDGYTAAFFL
nr:RNA-directed DNA polymerase, eukaryota, reverse transcriptase zinc-binding domain protein [Tanacetum cinerariifolium]